MLSLSPSLIQIPICVFFTHAQVTQSRSAVSINAQQKCPENLYHTPYRHRRAVGVTTLTIYLPHPPPPNKGQLPNLEKPELLAFHVTRLNIAMFIKLVDSEEQNDLFL
jgi:hypothetical protein